MRGLTDEERAELELFVFGPDRETEDDPSELEQSLIDRGLLRITTDEDDDYWWIVDDTPLGQLALRVDAAARAAGVRT